jgi:hypothetical protein
MTPKRYIFPFDERKVTCSVLSFFDLGLLRFTFCVAPIACGMFASTFLHAFSFKLRYAAITSVHLTEPQLLHGGKVSVFERGMVFFPPSLPSQ